MAETSNPILAAAKKGDRDELLALIQQPGSSLDAALSPQGHTALHVAAQHGHLEAVKLLINKGANVDAATKTGNTALMQAALKGHVEVATALLDARASVNAVGAKGFTPLHAAVGSESVPMMEVLLEAGANVDAGADKGHTSLHLAAQSGQPSAVSVLLAKGATVDLPDSSGRTALQYAAEAGHLEVVQQLFLAGAAVNAVYEGGGTALHAASAAGHLGVVQLLLASGADPSITDAAGCLALHFAAQAGCGGVVTLLLQLAPAQVNATDNKGFTPLNLASRVGSMEVLEALLAAGADPGAASLEGATALHGAATYGNHLFLQRLLDAVAAGQGRGGVVDAEFQGLTPLHCAVECKKMRCVEVLLEAGADPDKLYAAAAGPADGASLEGASPLHRAVAGRFAAAVPLLATPANMGRLWQGKTPLQLAVSSVDGMDWLRHVLSDTADLGSIYTTIKALLEAGSPAGVPDADGNTALTLAARSGDILLVELLPAMVRNECQRYKQLLEAEEKGQQDAATVRAGIVDGLYALLAAAAAATASKGTQPEASSAVEEGAGPHGSGDQPAPQAGDPPGPGQGDAVPDLEIPSLAAVFGHRLADPKYALECLEVVLQQLGTAEAGSMFQLCLLRACGCGQAAAGSVLHLLVYGVLHSGGWPELQRLVPRRWEAASRLRQLLGQPTAQAEQASNSGGAAGGLMLVMRAHTLSVAGAVERQALVQLLDQLAGLQMADTLGDALGQGQEGEAAQDMEGMKEVLAKAWAAAQQQVLCGLQQVVSDAVLGAVMAWEQAGGRGRVVGQQCWGTP